MKTPEVIYIPPIKTNKIYSMLEKPKNIGDYFGGIITSVQLTMISSQYISIF